MASADQDVWFAGLRFNNPIVASSGTFGYGYDYVSKKVLNQLGGFTIKGLTLHARYGNPEPRVCETPTGFINAIGLQNIGYKAFVTHVYPQLKDVKSHCILNLIGMHIKDYVELGQRAASLDAISALELNVSCPNLDAHNQTFDRNLPLLKKLITSCAKVKQKKPLLIKLSPDAANSPDTITLCEDAGADGLTLTNTFCGMQIDIHTRKPMLSTISGGYSGPGIKPIVLHMVYQAAKRSSLPILATGGVMTGKDAVEYLLAGASLVGVGTASLIRPKITLSILKQYQKYLKRYGISSKKLRGQCSNPLAHASSSR